MTCKQCTFCKEEHRDISAFAIVLWYYCNLHEYYVSSTHFCDNWKERP